MARVEGFEPDRSGQEPVDDNGNPLPAGVWGDSDTGVGVFGTSGTLPPGVDNIPTNIAGVEGHSIENPGTFGRSVQNAGVQGESIDSSGVLGRSANASGMLGVTFTPTPMSHGVFGSSTTGGNGVTGFVGNPTATGVIGSNPNGTGVRGSSGSGEGVHGESLSGTGVRGVALDTSATGVRGESGSGIGTLGISQVSIGMVGSSTEATGVWGEGGSGNSASGVLGTSVGGIGVTGSTGNGLAGVQGRNIGPGSGVFGVSETGDGVVGQGRNGGVVGMGSGSAGVLGVSLGAFAAGLFFGDVVISGTLSKGGGGFAIDHPLDPGNKYLRHSFVESPDMLNAYSGNVTTDTNGDAAVALPDYFEALNQDLRYQLTVIGQFAQAIVAEEVRNNQFRIKTDQPQVKVSWQITGVRQDPWAAANRIAVDEEKSAEERGRYLHPELWGQPEESRIHARPQPLEPPAPEELPAVERLEELPRTTDRARLEEEWQRADEVVQQVRQTTSWLQGEETSE